MEFSEDMKNKFRERLKKIIGKKFETLMIGSISNYEILFGHLWGDQRPESELTDEQLINRKRWQQCRKQILDLGNRQKANMSAEINQYDLTWNRYQTTLLPMKNFNKE